MSLKSKESKMKTTFKPMKPGNQIANKSHHCVKCFLMKRLWMVSVNMYDFMGLIDMCPCSSLHVINPYIKSKGY